MPGANAGHSPLRGLLHRSRRHLDRRAIAPSGQEAVLEVAVLDDLVGEPQAGPDQQGGDQQGQQVHRHAMTIVVGGFRALVLGEVVDRRTLLGIGQGPSPGLTRRRAARSEPQHTAFFIGAGAIRLHNRPDGLLVVLLRHLNIARKVPLQSTVGDAAAKILSGREQRGVGPLRPPSRFRQQMGRASRRRQHDFRTRRSRLCDLPQICQGRKSSTAVRGGGGMDTTVAAP